VVGAITLLGVVYLPYNLSAWGLFIYAGAFLGFGFRPSRALALLVCILAVVMVEGLVLDLPIWIWGAATVLTGIVGASNIHFAEVHRKNRHLKAAREEVERLAKGAERERIARDLHDLLGHTLTLIAVKSELAARLCDRDPERSQREIREVHRISRQALVEVRRAVQGYRAEGSAGLAYELASARGALESAEVEVELRLGSGPVAEVAAALGTEREDALALALREAVTNVLRHARARRCRISLERAGGCLRLEVTDDGRGTSKGRAAPDGAGLAGMRERIRRLGGAVERRSGRGTTLQVEVPLPSAIPAAAQAADEPVDLLARPAMS
jgi:two-component system sensor histidine kinase DesK